MTSDQTFLLMQIKTIGKITIPINALESLALAESLVAMKLIVETRRNDGGVTYRAI